MLLPVNRETNTNYPANKYARRCEESVLITQIGNGRKGGAEEQDKTMEKSGRNEGKRQLVLETVKPR